MLIKGLGALATGATVLVVLVAKFTEGAWVVALLAPALIVLMLGVRRHYDRVARQTVPAPASLNGRVMPPLVILPVETWNSVAQNALGLALTLSQDVEIVHVECEGVDPVGRDWVASVKEQARTEGRPAPAIVALRSPYRFVISPILGHVLTVEREHPDRTVAVVIPELVERHWYHYFLHNQRGELLTAMLLVKGKGRIAIVNVPWYLKT